MWDQLLQKAKNSFFADSKGNPSALGRMVGSQPTHQVPVAQPVKLAPPPKPKPIQVQMPKIATKITNFNPPSVPVRKAIPNDLVSPFPGQSMPMKQTQKQTIPSDLASPVATSKPVVKITPTSTPTPYPDMTPFEAKTVDTFRKYKIPLPVAYGVAAAEGGNRNKFNIGAVDSNPTLAPVWGELEAATKAAKLFSGQANPEFYGNGEAGRQKFKQAYALRDNPEKMLKAIMDAGYAGNPNTWKDRSVATGGAGLNFNSWSDFVKNTPAFKKWVGRK